MFKVTPEEEKFIRGTRAYMINMIYTIKTYAAEKLGDTWVRIKNKTDADVSYPKTSTEASLETLYGYNDLDSIKGLIKFFQVATEEELAAFVVLYGDMLVLIEHDIYNKYKRREK